MANSREEVRFPVNGQIKIQVGSSSSEWGECVPSESGSVADELV